MPPKQADQPSTKLWKEAFAAIQQDEDEREVIDDFCKVLEKEGISVLDLRGDVGRQQLLGIVDKKGNNIGSSTSPKMKSALKSFELVRGLVATGAAANPFATVAVAGFFIVFDTIQIYQAEKEAVLNIIQRTADIMYRSAIEDYQVNKRKAQEAEALVQVRENLRGAYVQLYRKILYLTMKVVYKTSGWRRWATFFSAWHNQMTDLEEKENRVEKYIRTIHRYETNPPVGAVVNWKQTDKKETNLHRLVKNGRTDDVFNLINTGQCPKELLNAKTSKDWTALMFAVKDGQWKIMNYLLDTAGIWVNAKNSDGNTALIIAAMNNRPGHSKRLLSSGAKVDIRNKGQRTAFNEAAIKGSIGVMTALLEQGKDHINQVTGMNGWSALHTAVDKENEEMVKWLIEKKIDKNIKIKAGKRQGLTAKGLAEAKGKTEMAKLVG